MWRLNWKQNNHFIKKDLMMSPVTPRISLLITVIASFLISLQVFADSSTNYTYTTLGQIASIDGPRTDVSDVTSYTYDPQGNLTTITNALGHVVTFANFDNQGHAQSVTDANGVVTILGYTQQGWLASSNTAGATTKYAYNAVGDLTRATLPDGSFLAYSYDDARRLISVANALGETQTYTLDAMGNRTVVQVKDASGGLTRLQHRTYDELGRLLTLVGANGQTTHYAYDRNNQRIKQTDARSNATTQAFDALGRVTQIVDPLSGVSALTYNADNKITVFVDPRGVTTEYVYDSFGRVLQVKSPDSGLSTYVYDEGGNVTQKTDGRGLITTYQYDALNRVTARRYPSNPTLDVLYTYDASDTDNKGIGRLTGVQDASGTVSYKYDGRGLLIAQDSAQKLDALKVTTTQSYGYDNAGRIASYNYPDGISVNYTRDGSGKVNAITAISLGDTYPIATNINYVPFGPVKKLTWGNGYELTRTYDQDYQLITQNVGNWQHQYSYDAVGNITSQQSNLWEDVQYRYDALNRLTREQAVSTQKDYVLDASGNRTSRTTTNLANGNISEMQQAVVASDSNRLTTINDFPLTYDESGNIQQHSNGLRYTYDASGRMNAVYQDGTQKVATYGYNNQGQRDIQINYDPVSGALLNGSVYLYGPNGDLIGQANYNSMGQKTLTRYWFWLDGMPLAQVELSYINGSNNGRRLIYLHPDHLNTPRLASTDQGVIWSWNSDAYGNSLPNEDVDGDGVKTNIPLRFPGQLYDVQTKLNYNYFRDYDPEIGRYIESDPVGLEGGLNTYGYVYGNPLKYSDSKGLNPAVAGLCFVPGVGWIGCGVAAAGTGAAALACYLTGTCERFAEACSAAWNEIAGGDESVVDTTQPENPPTISDDPSQPPGEGWEWRGRGEPGSREGAWYNPSTDQSLHDDRTHPAGKDPHVTYTDPSGKRWDNYGNGWVPQ
jgi:RHS repeat-associated protein